VDSPAARCCCPYRRRTPTCSLSSRFKTASNSGARQSLGSQSPAAGRACGRPVQRARAISHARSRKFAPAVRRVDCFITATPRETVRKIEAPAAFAERTIDSNRATSDCSRGSPTCPPRYIWDDSSFARTFPAKSFSQASIRAWIPPAPELLAMFEHLQDVLEPRRWRRGVAPADAVGVHIDTRRNCPAASAADDRGRAPSAGSPTASHPNIFRWFIEGCILTNPQDTPHFGGEFPLPWKGEKDRVRGRRLATAKGSALWLAWSFVFLPSE